MLRLTLCWQRLRSEVEEAVHKELEAWQNGPLDQGPDLGAGDGEGISDEARELGTNLGEENQALLRVG